jgi:hypothetical protein
MVECEGGNTKTARMILLSGKAKTHTGPVSH